MKFLTLAMAFSFVCSLTVFADSLDSASQEALQKTQALLKSKSQRDKYIGDNPAAQAADQKVKVLTGNPATQQQFYDTSSDIYSNIVKKSGGDVEKQKEFLKAALKDPEGFFKQLSPEQQEEILNLAEKIQKQSPPATPQN